MIKHEKEIQNNITLMAGRAHIASLKNIFINLHLHNNIFNFDNDIGLYIYMSRNVWKLKDKEAELH